MTATPTWLETDYVDGLPTGLVLSGGVGGAPYAMTLLTTTNPTQCLNNLGLIGAGFLVGLVNNSLVAQTVTVAIYDCASVTGISGLTPLMLVGQLGIGQVVTFPAPGLQLYLGCVADASGTPSGNGIGILVR